MLDDAALLTPALGRELVLTKDLLAEAVHFLPDDPPETIAAKLFAVNLSDLAAMGARPVGVLLGLGLGPRCDRAWLEAFTEGLRAAVERYACPLLGGDTIAGLERTVLSLTALGDVPPGAVLSRGGGRPGDELWVSGAIGDAAVGLSLLRGELALADPAHAGRVVAAYRTPEPRLALGLALRGVATAAMDVSDGLLLDAARLAEASQCAVEIALHAMPVSRAVEAAGLPRLELAIGGDDYELLFAAPPDACGAIERIGRQLKLRLTRIGALTAGAGIRVRDADGHDVTPARLGFEHRG